MRHTNKIIANLFLLIAFLIFIGTFLVNIQSVWLFILKRASEAALIGGIADWFAVTALFKYPFNIHIPHTNIIENNREQITGMISNMVNDTWLGKKFLGAEINKIDFYDIIVKVLERDRTNKKIRFYSRKYLIKFLKYSKTDKFNKFITDKLRQAVNKDLSVKILKGITSFVEKKEFDEIYDILSDYIKNYITEYETKDTIKNIIELSSEEMIDAVMASGKSLINDNFDSAVKSLCDFANSTIDENEIPLKKQIREIISKYKDNSVIKKLVISFATETKILDVELLSGEIILKIKNLVNDIKNDPSNDIRLKLRDYATGVLDNSGEDIRREVLNNIESIIYKNSDKLKGYLLNYMNNDEGRTFIKKKLLNFIDSDGIKIAERFSEQIKDGLMAVGMDTVNAIIDNNKAYILNKSLFRSKFDYIVDFIKHEAEKKSSEINSFVREKTVYAMKINHSIIGKLVRRYLESLNHKRLVDQIESKIGNDLQYIRINGALVGSVVGIIIALIGLLMKGIH